MLDPLTASVGVRIIPSSVLAGDAAPTPLRGPRVVASRDAPARKEVPLHHRYRPAAAPTVPCARVSSS